MARLDALVAQGGDLADDGLAFGVAVVEVGGDADADAGAVVDEEAALNKGLRDGLGARAVQGHGGAALFGIAGAVDGEAVLQGEGDEERGQAAGLLADGVDAHLADNADALAGGVQGGDGGGAAQEAVGIVGQVDGALGEGEGVTVGEPTGVGGPELGDEGGFDVDEGGAGAAAEPLQAATEEDIHIGFLDIEGEDADGVEGVEEDEGSALVGAADEGLQGDAVGAAIEDVR